MRAVLWTQGCTHNCPGCHNPSTHSLKDGFVIDTSEIINELTDNIKYQDGITLSGGDPFLQPRAVHEIAKNVKAMNKSVWAFTGFDYEDLINSSNENIKNLLNEIDVLVDGKFDINEFSLDLYYRGSRNQRIIDIQESIKQNKIVLIDKYMKDKKRESLNKKNACVFV